MNDLGLTLAWLGVQVALVLMPALALHALASRRGPAQGAWVATLSLALVVGLNAAALLPESGREPEAPPVGIAKPATARAAGAAAVTGTGKAGGEIVSDRAGPAAYRGWALAGLRRVWAGFGRGAAVPSARFRPWGSTLAALVLAGTGVGLIRLTIGLWAVGLCRRRGRAVDDPGMIALLDELRASMGVRPSVELREVPDLTTPATAGWRRPVLLLPADWRSWDASERRAVFAHELAHVIRGDYASGLLARLAVVLNSCHPMVHWMARRLQFQQELAADALGARFAGGRASYLVALSRLALRQDGRSPCWPLRAFLTPRGTLIRRIAMLLDETEMGRSDRPRTRAWRLPTAIGLLGLTIGVALLRGPARAAEDDPPAAPTAKVATPAPLAAETPFDLLYIPEDTTGVVAFRPAATIRRAGINLFLPWVYEFVGLDLSEIAKDLKVDTTRPDFLKIGWEDIEWVACGFRFGRQKDDLHRIEIGHGLTVRSAAPFDWLAFLRQWRFEFEEAREGSRVFYKVAGKLARHVGPNPCVYLPDDRTVVLHDERAIRRLLGRDVPAPPAFLRGPDWERVSHDLLAVAINNQDGTFAKDYDLDRPDDALVLSVFKGVDRWILGVDDAPAIALHAAAACRDRDASESITRAIDALLKLGRDAVEHPDPEALAAGAHDRIFRMVKALLANIRVERTDRSIDCRTGGFGTLADFASIVEAEAGEERTPKREGKDGSNDSER